MQFISLAPGDRRRVSAQNYRLWAFPNVSRWDDLVEVPRSMELPSFRAVLPHACFLVRVMKVSLFARRMEVCILDESGSQLPDALSHLCGALSDAWGVEHILTRLPLGDRLHESLLIAGFAETARLRQHLRLGLEEYVDVLLYSYFASGGGHIS